MDISTLYQHLNELEDLGIIIKNTAESIRGKPLLYLATVNRQIYLRKLTSKKHRSFIRILKCICFNCGKRQFQGIGMRLSLVQGRCRGSMSA
jgi:hypothetical protein